MTAVKDYTVHIDRKKELPLGVHYFSIIMLRNTIMVVLH